MGYGCCVPFCKSKNDTANVSMHVFTKDPELQKIWIQNIQPEKRQSYRKVKKPFKVRNHTKICSLHFEARYVLIRPGKRKLVKKAIPTLFSWTTPAQESPTNKRRSETNNTVKHEDKEIMLQELLRPTIGTQTEILYTHKGAGGWFNIENFKHDNKKIFFYTGFDDYNVLIKSLQLIFSNSLDRRKGGSLCTTKLTRENEYFLVLIKLRHNFRYSLLSKLFEVSVCMAQKIFLSWVHFMYLRLVSIDIWPNKKISQAHSSHDYTNIIGSLDVTEFITETPGQGYKGRDSAKGLIVIDPSGSIKFVSGIYTGQISNNDLLKVCGLVDIVEAKRSDNCLRRIDIFLADEGVINQEAAIQMNVHIPVLRMTGIQFTSQEISEIEMLVRERVEVERTLRRIKAYKILSDVVPVGLFGVFSQIWTVCCLLVNFRLLLRKQ